MINKIYKIINNKFSRYFKFIFFLRYLFVIFFVAIVLFATIPHFFDYKKKEAIISFNLSQSYGLEIKRIENIKFKSFPFPHLQISNLNGNLYSSDTVSKVEKLFIYPKLFSIYNYDNFQIRKIKLTKGEIQTDIKTINFLIQNIFNHKKKIIFKNLNLKIKDTKNFIIDIKKINFSNYGYYRNIISGKLFDKNFKIKLDDNLTNINFKLINTGVSASLNLQNKIKNNPYSGSLKGSILQSNYKFDFIYNDDSIEINNFFFRDKNLSFDSKGNIKLLPFFKINLTSEIKNFDTKNITNLKIDKLLEFKDLIKKLNLKKDIMFKSKKFSLDLIDRLDIKSQLAYGRLNILKELVITNSILNCTSNINLIEEYPILNFTCTLNSNDKKKLLKKIKVNYKKKDEPIYLDVKGNINILNNKINFDYIKMNNNYNATAEDLKYFKLTFESILFDKSFLNIFDLSKISKFVLEIL